MRTPSCASRRNETKNRCVRFNYWYCFLGSNTSSSLTVFRCFGGIYHIYLQGRRVSRKNQQKAWNTFFRNVDNIFTKTQVMTVHKVAIFKTWIFSYWGLCSIRLVNRMFLNKCAATYRCTRHDSVQVNASIVQTTIVSEHALKYLLLIITFSVESMSYNRSGLKIFAKTVNVYCYWMHFIFINYLLIINYGLVVRVLGYRSRGKGSIPGTTRFSEM
jgi:hypothetical protein